MIKRIALTTLFSFAALSATCAAEDDRTAKLSFDGIVLGRMLPDVELQPLFFDFDTGRYMIPPVDVLEHPPGQPFDLLLLNYTDKLKAWIRQQGLDAAFQTDGRSITMVAFEMKVGTWWTEAGELPKMTPQSIIEGLKAIDELKWVSFQESVPHDKPRAKLPFITREGGVGDINYIDLSDIYGPNSIQLRYEIARLDQVDNPVPQVPEPPILEHFTSHLVAEAKDGQLQLRVPAGRGTITIRKDAVVVSAAAHRDLVAQRIGSGWLDVDAARKRAVVRGMGGEAVLRAVGNTVRIDMNDKVAYDTRFTVSMPKVEIGSKIEWKPIKETRE